MDRIHFFFVALEYLNICEFSKAARPLKYLSDLEEWRHESRRLALLLEADTLLRKKVYRLNNDKRKEFPTFSSALLEVLKNHKQLWNDARSSAEIDKFKQAELDSTPSKKRRADSPPTPTKTEARAKRNRAKRERQKALLKKAKEALEHKVTLRPNTESKGSDKSDHDKRVPESEWKILSGIKYNGQKRCLWFNCSLGCRFSDQCCAEHSCLQCGGDHPYQ